MFFIVCGGFFGNGPGTGVFSSAFSAGGSYGEQGFRAVLVP